MLSRSEALELLKKHVKNEKLLKHMLAVEAIMRGVAEYLGEDAEKWGLTGLLHDVDFEQTADRHEMHGMLASSMLGEEVPADVLRAIESHNFEHTGVTPQGRMEKALVASDSLSGLIIAAALVLPSKRLEDLRSESIGKRFKEKDFARRCSRERILFCEQIGISREDFFRIALGALQGVASELGL
jgi:hypothetical protein